MKIEKTKDLYLRIIVPGNFIIEFTPDSPSKEIPLLRTVLKFLEELKEVRLYCRVQIK